LLLRFVITVPDMSKESDLQALERFVADNDDLIALEEQLERFNIFDALGIVRHEIRHSNYLAWLLSPTESHGQGDLFLNAVLMDILRKTRQQEKSPPISPVELDGADLQSTEIRREWRNIDMLIRCESLGFVIVIENKVGSGEHSNQLQRYESIVTREFPKSRKLFVFLTPSGEDASEPDWVRYSYADLHGVLTRALKSNAGAVGGDVAVFLRHYLSLIGSRFMENEDIQRLCRQIYINHRQALDLIWERVGTPSSALVSRIQAWMTERQEDWLIVTVKQGEVEFIPKAWEKMLPPIGKRRSFPLEQWLTLRLSVSDTRLRLNVVICPTTDLAIRKRVMDRLVKSKEEFGFATFFKRPSEDWTRLLSEDVCPLSEDSDDDLDVVMDKAAKRLAAFSRQTASLPAAMKELLSS
jgi:hypothetical protein